MLNDENIPDDVHLLKPKKKNSKTNFSILITALLGLLNFSKLAVFGKLLFTLLKASKFAGTFISMALTVVLYAQFYGWLFALGFVVSSSYTRWGITSQVSDLGWMSRPQPLFPSLVLS